MFRLIFSALLITCTVSFAWSVCENSASADAKLKREKVIDFEDEVVEGMNKRPLDSLSQLSEKDKKKHKPHLYRKRVGFRTETVQTTRELRYAQ